MMNKSSETPGYFYWKSFTTLYSQHGQFLTEVEGWRNILSQRRGAAIERCYMQVGVSQWKQVMPVSWAIDEALEFHKMWRYTVETNITSTGGWNSLVEAGHSLMWARGQQQGCKRYPLYRGYLLQLVITSNPHYGTDQLPLVGPIHL